MRIPLHTIPGLLLIALVFLASLFGCADAWAQKPQCDNPSCIVVVYSLDQNHNWNSTCVLRKYSGAFHYHAYSADYALANGYGKLDFGGQPKAQPYIAGKVKEINNALDDCQNTNTPTIVPVSGFVTFFGTATPTDISFHTECTGRS
jgi:hypothetical protein